MIHMTCRNCGWGLFGKAVMRVDSMTVDITCPRCGEVYRITGTKLHDGKPIDQSKIASTYDKDHNSVFLGEKK